MYIWTEIMKKTVPAACFQKGGPDGIFLIRL